MLKVPKAVPVVVEQPKQKEEEVIDLDKSITDAFKDIVELEPKRKEEKKE
jgi:hypothetical protein